jgi:hypothetical protein
VQYKLTGKLNPRTLEYLTTSWVAIAMSYHVVVTIAIALQLLLHRKTVNEVLGKNNGTVYAGVAATFVEFAMLVTIPSVIVISLCSAECIWSLAFPRLVSQLQVRHLIASFKAIS